MISAITNLNQTNPSPADPEEELRDLIKKNLELTEKMDKNLKYIKHYVISAQIFGVLKIIIIIVPIILGIIYLPPLLKYVFDQYQGLLGMTETMKQADPNSVNLDSLPPEIKKYLK